jgi:hypothetical protein
MILNSQTTFRIGGATGLLLLLVAISILPLAAMVRADDNPAKENAAARPQDAARDQQKGDERSFIASWHKDPAWKVKDCKACHTGLRHQDLEKAFEESGRRNRSEQRREEFEGATLGLRNLGFDEKLIQALVKDRAKLKDANHVLQNILRLTGEEEAKSKQDKAAAVDVGPGRLLRTVADDRPSSSGSGNRRIAVIIDSSDKRLKFSMGSTLKIGNQTVTIHRVGEHSMIVESDGRRMKWTVGQDFADAVDVGPASVRSEN